MKKLLALITVISLMILTASAANQVYDSLLNGYNINVPATTTIGGGSTNVLYTYIHGEINYSLTNNAAGSVSNGVVVGTLNTNVIAADAFNIALMYPDANGDVNANAVVMVSVGNTNLIPVTATNSVGQMFTTNWPFTTATYPTYMYPATTNTYPQYTGAVSNGITVSLFRSVVQGQSGLNYWNTMTDPRAAWESNPAFTFTVVWTNGTSSTTSFTVLTNLPIGFMQGARGVKAQITGGAAAPALVNQLGIYQPVP